MLEILEGCVLRSRGPPALVSIEIKVLEPSLCHLQSSFSDYFFSRRFSRANKADHLPPDDCQCATSESNELSHRIGIHIFKAQSTGRATSATVPAFRHLNILLSTSTLYPDMYHHPSLRQIYSIIRRQDARQTDDGSLGHGSDLETNFQSVYGFTDKLRTCAQQSVQLIPSSGRSTSDRR